MLTMLAITLILLFLWSKKFRFICKCAFKVVKFVVVATTAKIWYTLTR